MAINGTCIKEDFILLQNDPNIVVVPNVLPNDGSCCFELHALAELVKNTDPKIANWRNDQHSFIEYFSKNGYTGAKMYLQKYISGSWIDQGAELVDDTYGTNYAYGFYETIYQEKSIGYCMDFHKILVLLGEGDYRLKASGTSIFGGDTIDSYSLELCLRKWTVYRENKTARFDWYRNGNNGEPRDVNKRRDYGILNWFNQLRVPGIFWGEEATVTRESVKYQNGEQVWLKDDLINEYIFNSDRLPNYVHRFLKYDMFQADNIVVNDFNIINPTPAKTLRIYPNSGYAAGYDASVLQSSVELKFLDRVQQFTHQRS